MAETLQHTPQEAQTVSRPTVESLITTPDTSYSKVDLLSLARELSDVTEDDQLDAVREWANGQIQSLEDALQGLEALPPNPALDTAKEALRNSQNALAEVNKAVARREEALVAARPLTAEAFRAAMLNGSPEEWEATFKKFTLQIEQKVRAELGAAPVAEAGTTAGTTAAETVAGTTTPGATTGTETVATTTPEATPSEDEQVTAAIGRLEAYIKANPDASRVGGIERALALKKVPGLRKWARNSILRHDREIKAEVATAERKVKYAPVIDALSAHGIDVELDTLLAKAPREDGKIDIVEMREEKNKNKFMMIKAILLFMSENLKLIEKPDFISDTEMPALRTRITTLEATRVANPTLVTEYFTEKTPSGSSLVDQVVSVVRDAKRVEATTAPTGTTGGATGGATTEAAPVPPAATATVTETGAGTAAAPKPSETIAAPEAGKANLAEIKAALGITDAQLDVARAQNRVTQYNSLAVEGVVPDSKTKQITDTERSLALVPAVLKAEADIAANIQDSEALKLLAALAAKMK